MSIQQPFVSAQIPMIYDLSSDPHEDNNLMYTDLTLGWVYAQNFKWINGYERSVKEYPNIKVGEDFMGYPKK
jgi:arylsulfatase